MTAAKQQVLRLLYELMVYATHDVFCRKADFLAHGGAMEAGGHTEHFRFDTRAEGNWTGPAAAEDMRATFKVCLAECSVALGIATHVITLGDAGETQRAIDVFVEHVEGPCIRVVIEYGFDERGELQMGDSKLLESTPVFFRRCC